MLTLTEGVHLASPHWHGAPRGTGFPGGSHIPARGVRGFVGRQSVGAVRAPRLSSMNSVEARGKDRKEVSQRKGKMRARLEQGKVQGMGTARSEDQRQEQALERLCSVPESQNKESVTQRAGRGWRLAAMLSSCLGFDFTLRAVEGHFKTLSRSDVIRYALKKTRRPWLQGGRLS